MIITYKYKPIFNSNDFREFKKFVFYKYLKNRSYKAITPEVEIKLEKFFQQEYTGHKKLNNFCFTLIGNIPWTKQEFWTKRGWTQEEAIQNISEKQSKIGKKFAEKQKQNPGKYNARTSTQLQYWINKGYSSEKAKQKLFERQSTFSYKKMYEKYGKEKGEKIVQERNQKWQQSLKENNDMDKLNKSKGASFNKMVHKYGYERAIIKYNNWIKTSRETCINSLKNSSYKKASKQSLIIFEEFYNKMINLFNKKDIYIGLDGQREFFIQSDNRLCFYDFTIKPLKLIFEYNGSHVHPNINVLNENEWNNWYHTFTKLSANKAYELDQEKIKIAENKGFNVIELWDSDTIEYNKQIVSESIKQKLNEFS